MAHFAKLDENNKVIDVVVVDNDVLRDSDGVEKEEIGIEFLIAWSNGYSNWKQTSYNKTFRKNYASLDGYYDPQLDAFIPPKTYPSWILNETTCRWEPPVPMPADQLIDKLYEWDEGLVNWVCIASYAPVDT